MKKYKKNKQKNKKYLYVAAVLVASTLGLLTVFELSGLIDLYQKNSPTTKIQGPTIEEKATDDMINAENKNSVIEGEKDKNLKHQNDTEQTSTQTDKRIDLRAYKNNSNVIIQADLYGISEGVCDLSIKNNDSEYSDQAPLLYQSVASTCEGFSVPVEALGTGNWEVVLSIVDTAEESSKKINFNVN